MKALFMVLMLVANSQAWAASLSCNVMYKTVRSVDLAKKSRQEFLTTPHSFQPQSFAIVSGTSGSTDYSGGLIAKDQYFAYEVIAIFEKNESVNDKGQRISTFSKINTSLKVTQSGGFASAHADAQMGWGSQDEAVVEVTFDGDPQNVINGEPIIGAKLTCRALK